MATSVDNGQGATKAAQAAKSRAQRRPRGVSVSRIVDIRDADDRQGAPRSVDLGSVATGATPAGDDPIRVLYSREEDAADHNPLTYRERAYLVPAGATPADAEEALYQELERIRGEIDGLPSGKYVMLSMFVDAWEWRPTTEALVVLEWKDWRGAPTVRYPSAEAGVQPSPAVVGTDAPGDEADRHAANGAAPAGLSNTSSAAQAVDFVAGLLDKQLHCAATAVCLYDVQEDCLRVVGARGHADGDRCGRPLPRGAGLRSAGLLGAGVAIEGRCTVFDEPEREPGFVPSVDGYPGLRVRSMLVRPISHGGQLLGALQLLNPGSEAGFSIADQEMVDTVAQWTAECLLRLRLQSSSSAG